MPALRRGEYGKSVPAQTKGGKSKITDASDAKACQKGEGSHNSSN